MIRYEGQLYRPPSEADSLILQATIGCSWNKCTYCDMYREKEFRVRDLAETLADLELARQAYGPNIEKIFVADGDALVLPLEFNGVMSNIWHDVEPASQANWRLFIDQEINL